ncbi:D-alanyl-D-alanine carboxypeptidase [Streptomyces sp. NPDC048420]|uniref:D-alanyl-D-alanine carboxypeptidase n=1 Tax=Streptomyces sp. NPDC048420 TaxID=3155755 RepID=UPI00343F04B9
MEEASVAGESPDRSKQRESSAEPTSGSASPVPEARSSTRDPRLAVARESISLGGVDTATRVFSVRDLPRTPEEAPESPAEAGAAGSGPGEPEDAPPAPEKGAEEPEAAENTGGDTDTAEGSQDTASTETPAEDPEDSDSGAGDSGTAEGADDSESGPGDSGTAESSRDSESGRGDSATAESADSSASGPGDSATAESSRHSESGRGDSATAESADSSASGPGDSATAESSRHSGSGPGDSATAADSEDPGSTEAPDESATPESAGDSDSGPGDSAEGDAPATPGDARLRDVVAAWVATGDGSGPKDGSGKAKATEEPEGKRAEPADETSEDEPGPDTETGSDTEPEPTSESDAAETAVAEEAPADNEGDDPEPGDSNPPGARGTARPADTDPQTNDKPDEVPQPATDEPNSSGAQGNAESAAAPTDPRPDDEPADADVADEPPVDQPTAVFKAPRPPVDQPTTMLKLGKAAEPKESPEPKDVAAPRKPEAEAERTSRFVALKALDEPRESRPKADVTAAVPQVGPERTTQQPLPPKPPLDLLAELTNTPPPPPSPLRTLGRRVKIWTPILILLVVVFAIVQAVRPLPNPTLSLTAEDSYTFDGSKATLPWPGEGQGWMDVNGVGTMGDFGKQTPVAIGSVAKAMTAYIVLKDHPLKSGEEGAKITVDALAEKEGGYNKEGESTLNTVKEGDVLTERQAISAIMIPSANNIARLLARWDAGSEAAFIKKMNDTAKELGMKNTTYTDASGLKETTVSSAEDQVKLGNELVKIPALTEITSMGQWIDPSGQKWYNYNYLVPYNGAIGIKTGTTTAAGGNLLFAARKEVGGETVTVVGAILGQHKSPIIQTVNDVSKTAMLAAQDALTSAKILKKGDVVGYVDDGLGGHTPVVLTKDVTAVGWAGFKVKLSFAADDVPHTAKAGTKVGTLTVGDGEAGAVKVPVTLQKDLTEPGFTDKLTRVG